MPFKPASAELAKRVRKAFVEQNEVGNVVLVSEADNALEDLLETITRLEEGRTHHSGEQRRSADRLKKAVTALKEIRALDEDDFRDAYQYQTAVRFFATGGLFGVREVLK